MRAAHQTILTLALATLLFSSSNALAFKIISYDGKLARWPDAKPSYVIDSHGSDNFTRGCDEHGPCTSEFMALEQSFATWAKINRTEISFQKKSPKSFNRTGYDDNNTLIFIEKDWTSLPFSPPRGALAVTVSTYRVSDNAILDGDIHFNGEYFQWGVVDTENERTSGTVIDIQNVATHEIGHFVGLDHSSENIFESEELLYLATMFFASGPGETFRRDLNEDDIAAMQNLYADASYQAPTINSVTPGAIDATAGTAVVKITGEHFEPFASVVIATNSDRGDVGGEILYIDDQSIDVSFEVYALQTGLYDIVVSNSAKSFERVDSALDIQGTGTNYGEDSYAPGTGFASSGGGCSIIHQPTDSASAAAALLMLALPLILIGWSRFQLRERSKDLSR